MPRGGGIMCSAKKGIMASKSRHYQRKKFRREAGSHNRRARREKKTILRRRGLNMQALPYKESKVGKREVIMAVALFSGFEKFEWYDPLGGRALQHEEDVFS